MTTHLPPRIRDRSGSRLRGRAGRRARPHHGRAVRYEGRGDPLPLDVVERVHRNPEHAPATARCDVAVRAGFEILEVDGRITDVRTPEEFRAGTPPSSPTLCMSAADALVFVLCAAAGFLGTLALGRWQRQRRPR